jgi:protein transport protein DSL1/ZW10
LTPSASYTALGTIIDAVLDQMLQDVLTIRDISETQSERIAILFRIMHPLDTLFPELDNGVRMDPFTQILFLNHLRYPLSHHT